jgi:hypothetical protein
VNTWLGSLTYEGVAKSQERDWKPVGEILA